MVFPIIGAVGAAVGLASAVPMYLGFTTAGIAAGSVAAGIQSGIGSVAAGSWFATMTSLGMKGAFVYGAGSGAAVAAGAAVGGTTAALSGAAVTVGGATVAVAAAGVVTTVAVGAAAVGVGAGALYCANEIFNYYY